MRSRRRRPGACGILVRVVVAGWAAIVAGGPGARAGDGPEDATRLLVETIDRLIAAGWAENRVDAGAAGRRRRVPPPGVARPDRQDPDGRRGPRVPRRPEPGQAASGWSSGCSTARRTSPTSRTSSGGCCSPRPTRTGRLRLLAPAFEAWLREQVAENAGYDRIVREILTVAGRRRRRPATQPAVPSLGRVQEPSPLPFYVAKDAKPENLAASTARLFLGLRLECAQCHNHPFATWTREQFWGYAAFFAGVEKQGPDDGVAATRSARSPTAARWPSPAPRRSSRPPSSTAARPGLAARGRRRG